MRSPTRHTGAVEVGTPEKIHFGPDTYLEMVVAEVPGYQELQDRAAEATRMITATSILELGVGAGEATMRVLARHPASQLVEVDESPKMIEFA